MPKIAITGSYGKHVFSFKTNCQSIFQNVSDILHSYPQYVSDHFSAFSLAFSIFFFTVAILIGA